MGQNALCKAQINGVADRGMARLECDAVFFRGTHRLKIPLGSIRAAEADGDVLRLEYDKGSVAFDLGPAASKWADKIRSPKSVLDKLGVKTESRVRVAGITDNAFLADLANAAPHRVESRADLVFFEVREAADLQRLSELRRDIEPNGAIWIVYPKGIKAVTQADVMREAKSAGLVDTKICSFSASHSALKVVIPVAQRTKTPLI